MASALRGSLSKVKTVCTKTSLLAPKVSVGSQGILSNSAARCLTLNRDLGSISSLYQGSKLLESTNRQVFKCQKCSIHTDGDSKLAEFLSQEIASEKKGLTKPVSKVEGWTVETDGTSVTLTKTFNNEKIKVEFDVVDCVNEEPGYEGQEEAGSNMVARPPFEVQIIKQSGRKLTFNCEFTEQEPGYEEADPEEEIEDQFNIIEVRVDEAKSSDGIEKFYYHSSSVMDGTLYDLLMDMLDERGIDDTFINNMVDFATSYENRQYVDFLQKLDSIVKEN